MSVLVAKSAPSLMSFVKSVLAGVGNFFATFAAAAAVSEAVENHRQPKASDLAALGLEGVRFKQYY